MLNIKWDITYKCNLNCNHCLRGDKLNLEDKELTTDEVKLVIDKLLNKKINAIHFLGGEPIFRKDFEEIASYLKEKKIYFGFNTNGLYLDKENIINIIEKNEYLKNIVISLEGPNAKINDEIRGKNVFDIVVPKIQKIVSIKNEKNLNNLDITINTVVSKVNFKYIPEMIEFMVELGVQQYNMLGLIEEGNANESKLSLSFEDEIFLIKEIGEKYQQYKDIIALTPRFLRPIAKKYAKNILNLDFPDIVHGCGAGSNFAFINNKGEIYPCDRFDQIVLNKYNFDELSLVKNDFYEIWGKELYAKAFELTEGFEFYNKFDPCNECEYLQKTCFPCPVYNLNTNKKFILTNCKKYFQKLKCNEVKVNV